MAGQRTPSRTSGAVLAQARTRAVRTVVSRVQDAAEAALLLEMLGLAPTEAPQRHLTVAP